MFLVSFPPLKMNLIFINEEDSFDRLFDNDFILFYYFIIIYENLQLK